MAYIDVDFLKDELMGARCITKPQYMMTDEVFMIVDSQPTADVEEVKHAKWEINSDGYYPYCGNCKTEPKNGVMSKRCPECGAKMDGGNAE